MSSLGSVSRTPRALRMSALNLESHDQHHIDVAGPRRGAGSVASFGAGAGVGVGAAPTVDVAFPARQLRMWNGAMSLFHFVFMITTLAAGNLGLSVPVYKTSLQYIERASGEASGPAFVIVPQYSEMMTLPLTWIVAAFFFASSLAHFGNATLWRGFYERELAQCRVPTRWIEYFFSASIMIFAISYGVGVREFYLLLGIVALISTTMLFGYLTELIAAPCSESEWHEPFLKRAAPHLLGYIPQLAAWAIIVFHFYTGPGEGSSPPGFVYAIVWIEMGLFFSFGFVQLAQQLMPPSRYYLGEIAYQWLSLIAKGFLGLLLLTNVLVLSSFDEMFAPTTA